MMDRDQADQQATCQVGFLSGICIPCYDILNTLIPETSPMLEGCQANLTKWKELAEEEKKVKEGVAADGGSGKQDKENESPAKPQAPTDDGNVKPGPKSPGTERKPSLKTVSAATTVIKKVFTPSYNIGVGTAATTTTDCADPPNQRVIPTITTTQPE